jgi:2'-5' RNA ligase
MRLFYAVPADPPTRDAALGALGRLRAGPGEYRFTDPADLHVTLTFLGETPDAEVPRAEALLREVAARTAPFEVEFGAVGAFDSPDDARVVWLGVDAGTDALARLASALGRREPRPYTGHLTLGYRRGDRSPPAMGDFLRRQPRVALRRPVTQVALFASAPRGERPAYRLLAEAVLAGSGVTHPW